MGMLPRGNKLQQAEAKATQIPSQDDIRGCINWILHATSLNKYCSLGASFPQFLRFHYYYVLLI